MCLTPKGIQNLNNTCFANSILQAMLSVQRFSKGLDSIQHNREKCFAKRTGEMKHNNGYPGIFVSCVSRFEI